MRIRQWKISKNTVNRRMTELPGKDDRMYIDEYGKENEQIIVMLHGANFVHSFGRQYALSDRYHMIVPHLMGFGNETSKTFQTGQQIRELVTFIESLGQKVLLVGFSLGAQIAAKMVAEHPELFTAAILISPWLIKPDEMVADVMKQNEKQFALFKKKGLCYLVGLLNGLPKGQRKEFVCQMQSVTIETIRNSVDNGITLDTIHGFENVEIPVIALAGEREQNEVKDSVKRMAEKNKNCHYAIWDKAAHNIPLVNADKLNALIVKVMQDE